MYSSYPREEICHGGCECSVIKNKIDSVDIISIGCIIQNYHTIYETTYIDSWIKIYNLLLNFIEIT